VKKKLIGDKNHFVCLIGSVMKIDQCETELILFFFFLKDSGKIFVLVT